MEEDIILDFIVNDDVLIVYNSTILLVNDKAFIQDSEVEDISIEQQSLLVLSLEEKNVRKASFKEISNEPKVAYGEVQSILNLDFIPNNMGEIVQEP